MQKNARKYHVYQRYNTLHSVFYKIYKLERFSDVNMTAGVLTTTWVSIPVRRRNNPDRSQYQFP